ncbi:Fungal-trans domain-containing protein [Mycena kentingensis (nom. inval.)]|nr:Fungal-trans domain-containing protein [Mycena kentingensis (nom. inval.)]
MSPLETSIAGDVPQLVSLRLRPAGIGWNWNIVHLSLYGWNNLIIFELVDALKRTPLLETMTLDDMLPNQFTDGSGTLGNRVRLGRLTSLLVLNAKGVSGVAQLLTHVSFPSSLSLSISCGPDALDSPTDFLALFASLPVYENGTRLRSIELDSYRGVLKLRGWTRRNKLHALLKIKLVKSSRLSENEWDLIHIRAVWALNLRSLESLLVRGICSPKIWACAFGDLPSLHTIRYEPALGDISGLVGSLGEDVIVEGVKLFPVLPGVLSEASPGRPEILVGGLFFPVLETLELEQYTLARGSVDLDPLLTSLMERCERMQEIQTLKLQNCMRLSRDDVERLCEIVIRYHHTSMLSAFAARKAALPKVEASAPPIPPTPPHPLSIPTQKRKLAQTPNSSRKRKKKPDEKAQNEPQPQPEVILLDSDEEEDADELEVEDQPLRRAYSPSAPVDDSDDSDEELVEILDVPIPPASFRPSAVPPPSNLSTFSPIVDNNTFLLSPEESVALGLAEGPSTVVSVPLGMTLALVGVFSVTVLRGTASLYGARVPASRTAHEVFAPRSAPIPIITALDAFPTNQDDVPTRLKPAFTGSKTVLVLKALHTGVEGLGRVCRVFEGVFSPPRLYQAHKVELVATAALVREPHKDLQPLFFPRSWQIALDALNEHQDRILLIRGSKNVGKSTIARALLNRLVSQYRRVAYLECDLGQSEFTPGGMVALTVVESPVFGPPFTHLSIPSYAHYLGTATPKQLPAKYLAAVQGLVETYRLEVQTMIGEDGGDDRNTESIPLIVNTMGWTKGLGAELGRKIEELVRPTDIFEFDSTSALHHSLESIAPSALTANFTAADHRSLTMLSYFYRKSATPRWDATLPLCSQRPYEVDWNVAFDNIVLSGAGTEDVVHEEVLRVLNGALVGLVECESDGTFVNSENRVPYTPNSDLPSPINSLSTCHGLALIRAVSPSSTHLQLITPIPPHLLAKCRVLVKGDMELPVWGMIDFTTGQEGDVAGTDRARVPFLQWDKSEGLGGEKRRVRRNLMRKAQR